MKYTTQISTVAAARPSVKSCFTTKTPPLDGCSSTPGDSALGSTTSGAIRVRYRLARASSPPLTSRKRMDSGSRKNAAAAIRIGTTPPTRNTDCQPNRGMRAAATKPPTAAPSEKPQIIVITAVARRRRGMYSEVKAMAFGIAPPMPSPVNTRNAISASTDCAVAVNSDPTPKISADTTRTGFRPTRSATGPLSNAPIIIPTRPVEITEPRTLRGMCRAAVKAGATYPMAWASNPSTETMSPHITAAISW